MHLHDNTFDSVHIRLHIFPLLPDNSVKTAELLKENIFITCKKDQKWVYADLKPYHITVSQPIIAAVEWVDSRTSRKNRTGDSNVLTISLSNKDGAMYIRNTPEELISVSKGSYTPAMYFETFRAGPNIRND